MKFISWNVNGLRAVVNKGFLEYFETCDADLFAIQETKMQEGQLNLSTPDYYQYFNYAERKGYSGTAVFAKKKPLSVSYGIDKEIHSHEGRAITLEYDSFYFVCVYVPNAQDELKRIDYRLEWERDLKDYLGVLKTKKSVILCGDLNVAHEPIDLKNPKPNEGHAGYSLPERNALSELLASGFIDTYRFLYPTQEGAYSWWSYRFNARSKNAGWRIDYFLVSEDLRPKIASASIYNDVFGSDHCPIGLEMSDLS